MTDLPSSLIDQFCQATPPDDWDEGLDLYQSGQVQNVKRVGALITGNVKSFTTGKFEDIRLRIQEEYKTIQWIECTCKKNRKTSILCEHIAAVAIYIDRESPSTFKNLNSNLTSRSAPKKIIIAENILENSHHSLAAASVFEKFADKISSATLLALGPQIRVYTEIIPGSISHFDLSIDDSARFLVEHQNEKLLSMDLKRLKVHEVSPLELAWLIRKTGEETIEVRKIFASLEPVKIKSNQFNKDTLKKIARGLEQNDYKKCHWINYDDVKKNLGKNYFFIPDHGYFKFNDLTNAAIWREHASLKSYSDDQAAELIERSLSPYAESGSVFLDESFKNLHIVQKIDLGSIKILDEHSGWFHLDPVYQNADISVSMYDLILQYKNKKRKFIRVKDQWIKIPELAKENIWKIDDSTKSIEVDILGLMRMRAAMGEFDMLAGSKRILEKIRSKVEFQQDVKTPGLQGTSLNLREYQQVGYQWMWWLRQNSLHGLLADEMGLGKTHQSMAFMAGVLQEKKDAKFLILCPTTVLDHWLDKMNAFAPALKPFVYHGAKRMSELKTVGKTHQSLITSYGILLRDNKTLTEIEWDAIILDEAHSIKNSATATYAAVCKLRGKTRICMSGTPIENNLTELKSIFDFLLPGYFGSDDFFRRNFVLPITQRNTVSAELNLQRMIHPFKMRRTKNLVLKDLPEKVEDVKHCHLSEAQIKLYREVVDLKSQPLLRQLADENTPVSYLHVFAVITLLKQICDHPRLVAPDMERQNFESGKFELLKGILSEALDSGHKIVIFSQYLGMIALIEEYLKSQNINYAVLTGQTTNRGQVIKRFQEDDNCKIFCGSLLAGGIGIDLTAASVVIHYDRWWNASKENQATDRVHRIGQNKNVQVYKLVTRGTLEEKIDLLIASKKSLIEKFLDRDEEMFKSFSRHELIELLT